MKKTDEKKSEERITEAVSSRIKNPQLVRKKQLLIAKKASRLFIKKGYDQTTMREISKATGIAMGNLYDYISKKEDVLCLVFEVYYQNLREYLKDKGVFDIDDPREQMKAYIHHALANYTNFREELVLMYRDSRRLPKKYLEKVMQRELEDIRSMEGIIQRGIERGLFQVDDPYFAATMIFYQASLPAMRGWTFKGHYSEEEVLRRIEEYILNPFLG